MTLIALSLALLAGFAAQRGSICAVAAVKSLIVDRNPARYRAFIECAAWSLAVIATARALGVTPSSNPLAYPAGITAAIGGALFGVGASLNGACTFGTVARLGRGEISFLAMPAGFIIGVIVIAGLIDAPTALDRIADPTRSSFAAMLIVFFVGYQIFRLSNAISGPRAALEKLAAKQWPPSLSMAVIGIVSGLLMVFFSPWPYSKLLVDIGADMAGDHQAFRIVIAVFFVGGAFIGARSIGSLVLRKPSLRFVAEKIAGGAMMGAGSYLAPGGNDSMVLVGLPHLFLYAVIAYLSMSTAIAAMVLIERRKN